MRTAIFWVITQHISDNTPEERSSQFPWTSPSLMMKASHSFSSSLNANPDTTSYPRRLGKSSSFFCINNQQDASSIQNFIFSRNSTCFGHLLCPSSGVTSCTRGNWYVSCRLRGRCLRESGWNYYDAR
jgi:hypothetical protein